MDNMIEQLADLLRAEPNYAEATSVFVSLYLNERAYGGPEEGGWWYDVVKLDGSIEFTTRTAAETFLSAARTLVERKNAADAPLRHKAMASLPDHETAYHPEGFIPLGWSDGGKWMIVIEDRQGSHDNSAEGRPHYE